MSNIKKINELRKLIKETKWLDINLTKEQALSEFKGHSVSYDEENNNLKCSDQFIIPKSDEKGVVIKGSYGFNITNFKKSINKKKGILTRALGLSQTKNARYGYYSYDSLRNMLPEKLKVQLEKNEQTYSTVELRGDWSRYNQPHFSNMVVFVNDFTDEILYVKYAMEDVWFNNFFRNCFEKSIQNNWEDLHTEKQFNLIYEQRTYKIVPMTALTNQLAQEKAVKEMPELEWKSGRNNGDYNYVGVARDDITETPKGDFLVDTHTYMGKVGIAKKVNFN